MHTFVLAWPSILSVILSGCCLVSPAVSSPDVKCDCRIFDHLFSQTFEKYPHQRPDLFPLIHSHLTSDLTIMMLLDSEIKWRGSKKFIILKELPKNLQTSKRVMLLLAVYYDLEQTDSEVVVSHLSRFLNSPSSGTRAQACAGLGRLSKARAAIKIVPTVKTLLTDQNQAVKLYAAWALWQIQRDKTMIRVIAQGLHCSDTLANLSARLLGEIGPPAVVALHDLRENLDHKSATVRAQIMFTLGQIGKDAGPAIPDLRASIRKTENLIRVQVRQEQLPWSQSPKFYSIPVHSYARRAVRKILAK